MQLKGRFWSVFSHSQEIGMPTNLKYINTAIPMRQSIPNPIPGKIEKKTINE